MSSVNKRYLLFIFFVGIGKFVMSQVLCENLEALRYGDSGVLRFYSDTTLAPFSGVCFYYHDDKLKPHEVRVEVEYQNGIVSGFERHFYRSGQVKSITVNKNGVEHGLYEEYHENGVIKETGRYFNGSKSGIWQQFDEKGTLVSAHMFVLDEIKRSYFYD